MTKIVPISFVVVFLALISCKHALEPTELGYHNKILFASSRSGKEQLYMMNPDGSDIRQITSGPFWHNYGRWSLDAKQIVYNTQEGSSTAGISMVVMNADGTNRRLLGWGAQMAWSPDGKEIYFTLCGSCELGIYNFVFYSIDANGQNIQVVFRNWGGEASFSPEGKTVALPNISYTDTTRRNAGIILRAYPGFASLKAIGPADAADPSWSPAGQEIIFSSRKEGRIIKSMPANNIWIINSDGSNARRITDNLSANVFLTPRWSPDGKRIAFILYLTDGTTRSYLYMVNKDGTNFHKIIDDSTITSCDWSR